MMFAAGHRQPASPPAPGLTWDARCYRAAIAPATPGSSIVPRAALAAMITAIYQDAPREVVTIMKTVPVCPIFGDDFSPGDEFSAHMTAKSPSGEIST
jgi:hypothetical protein